MIQIDFDKYIKLNLPRWNRKPKLIAFIQALFAPLKWLYAYDFTTYRDRSIYLSRITGQTMSLQEHLNNELDMTHRNIQIIHRRSNGLFAPLSTEGYEVVFISLEEENSAVFVALEGEDFQELNTGFIVLIPSYINKDRVIGIVETYKLAGKAFRIEIN